MNGTTTITAVLTRLPGPSFSKSRGQRRGLKCWAKEVLEVASPARTGHDYAGRWVGVGYDIELEAGAVLIHHDSDNKTGLGVVVPASEQGRGAVVWMHSACSGWAGALAAATRQLLDADVAQRVRLAAEKALNDGGLDGAEQEHYARLASGAEAAAETATDPEPEWLAVVHSVLAEHEVGGMLSPDTVARLRALIR